MSARRCLQIILAISLFGVLFAGLLSYRELTGATGACTPLGIHWGSSGMLLGYPPCVYGTFIFAVLTVIAALGLRSER